MSQCLWGPNPLSAREVLNLVDHLSPDGSVGRAVSEHKAAGWGFQEELLAVLAELIDKGNRDFFSAYSEKGTPQPAPIYIARPVQKKKRVATKEDMRRMFGGAPIIKTKRKKKT